MFAKASVHCSGISWLPVQHDSWSWRWRHCPGCGVPCTHWLCWRRACGLARDKCLKILFANSKIFFIYCSILPSMETCRGGFTKQRLSGFHLSAKLCDKHNDLKRFFLTHLSHHSQEKSSPLHLCMWGKFLHPTTRWQCYVHPHASASRGSCSPIGWCLPP